VKFCSKWMIKLIFLVFSEELLHATMWLKLPRAERQGAKKEVCFVHRILVSHFLFGSWFYMMSTSM
jgi:hypothetical protein